MSILGRLFALLLFPTLPIQAGLNLEVTSQSGQTQDQVIRLPALVVEKGTPPAPGLVPGQFTAVFSGKLIIPKRYRLYFSVKGIGQASLKVGKKELLTGPITGEESERIRLNPGEHELTLSYQSPIDGSGSLRLFWRERKLFPSEPIPSASFTTIASQPDAAHLVAAHRCTACHQENHDSPHAMPELSLAGPDLTNIGARRHQSWLTRWIAQPDKLKPTTTMPALVDHTKPEGAQAAADIAAYLATLKPSDPTPMPAPTADLAQQGGAHFHHLGCVACHTLPQVSEPDQEHDRIPLNNVAAKFRGADLIAFLKDPQAKHPAAKMPNFRLSDDEAKALSAFLVKESTGRHTPDPSEFPPGDPTEGAKLTAALNCAACHDGLTPSTAQPAPAFSALKDWTQGCRGPRVNLSKDEFATIAKAASTIPACLNNDTPSAYATRQIEALRCNSCHQHDSQAPTLSVVHAESKSLIKHLSGQDEKMEQSRPPLTHMGAMLHGSYLEAMLQGTTDPRPRPWLDMRMPGFPAQAKQLALGLAHQHGLSHSQPEAIASTPEQLKAGAQLLSLEGYACVTCHGVGDKPALAAFEVQGINFALTHQRLRPGYFHQWMHHPTRLVPDTKMPRYTNEDGSALRSDLLDGDAKKQFEAIRAYLGTLKN